MGVLTRVKETRERYERPRRQVHGSSNPHYQNQTYRSLKINQAFGTEKTKKRNWSNSMVCVHLENFIGFTVQHSSIVTFFPLTLAFFYSTVIKS
jgi:hypothetical protein